MKKVLLLEDDPAVREPLAQALTAAGWDVLGVATGESGLGAALEHRPAAVICDLLRPQCNGFQVCRTLRESASDLPDLRIIITTSRDFGTDRFIAFESGADHFLVKPICAAEVVQMLAGGPVVPPPAVTPPAAPEPRPAASLPAGNFLRFWGVRGSIPIPGPDTVFYGGNTACVELRADGQLIVLDAGSGIRLLGQQLVKEFADHSLSVTLLLTHTHWDHIQGFPFFAPAYQSGHRVRIVGYQGYRRTMEEAFRAQMESSYFPVGMQQLPGHLSFVELEKMEFEIGAVRARASFVNHPAICVGYRLETSSGTVAFIPDHENYLRQRVHRRDGTPAGQDVAAFCRAEDAKLVEFLKDVDVLIMDTQYDEREYEAHIGWGHSCFADTVATALAAGVSRLFLFHHDPTHDDAAISRMVAQARAMVAQQGGHLLVEAAREGRQVEVSRRPAAACA